jgi:urea carboxylase
MVEEGDTVVIIESMKMEISVIAPCAGRVSKVLCRTGSPVTAGQNLIVLEEQA